MSRLLAWTALAVTGVLSGCGVRLARVPPQLDAFGGLVVTNSPMQTRRVEPTMVADHMEIVYSVLFENVGAYRATIELDHAKVSVPKTVGGSASCAVNGQPLTALSLRPGERWRVDCRLVLSRESTAALTRTDEDVTLSIPVRTAAGPADFSFYYWLRIEDAS